MRLLCMAAEQSAGHAEVSQHAEQHMPAALANCHTHERESTTDGCTESAEEVTNLLLLLMLLAGKCVSHGASAAVLALAGLSRGLAGAAARVAIPDASHSAV